MSQEKGQLKSDSAAKQDQHRTFDIHDRSRVRHEKIGHYDWYVEIPRLRSWNMFARWERLRAIPDSARPLLRFAQELAQMPGVPIPLITYILSSWLESIIPALTLWYSTQMLRLIQSVIESRALDFSSLRMNTFGGIVCALLSQLAQMGKSKSQRHLENCAERYVAQRKLRADLNLDLPSSEDPGISAQMAIFQGTTAWRGLSSLVSLAFLVVQSISQGFVFIIALYREPSMLLYAIVSLIPVLPGFDRGPNLWSTTWAATTTSSDYISVASVNWTMRKTKHRKEIEVGNLQDYLYNKWVTGSDGVKGVGESFFQAMQYWQTGHTNTVQILLALRRELADIALLIQTMRSPSTLPTSYASLSLIRSTIGQITGSVWRLQYQAKNFSQVLNDFRQLYEMEHIPKKVINGHIPFPENTQELRHGLSVEFRNVSFKYPRSDSERYVLKNASFKVESGQLCVIVGTNGSGKSTLMKLLLRLYDPSEGNIFINGQDIRTLKIKELRSCVATLFQDFTIFPFSIRENIALGSPSHASDTHLIQEAAKLGGCSDIIDRLPKGMDSFLSMPITNWFCRIPKGTTSLFGSKDLHRFSRFPGGDSVEDNKLSGGEQQRLALARCFMRTLSEEDRIALLLFDEPSAALDPEAEYDLFERLRKLRGSKTMIFSSHRFGNLTRHADLILYMKDAEILEQGNHIELIKLDGGYASMYKIQASAFQD